MIPLSEFEVGSDVVVFDEFHDRILGGYRYGTPGFVHSHGCYGLHSHVVDHFPFAEMAATAGDDAPLTRSGRRPLWARLRSVLTRSRRP